MQALSIGRRRNMLSVSEAFLKSMMLVVGFTSSTVIADVHPIHCCKEDRWEFGDTQEWEV